MTEEKYAHVTAAVNFCDLVRTTLGPKGMNKMVVGKETVLTNDGATIVNSIRGGDPIVELFKNLAKSQEDAVGDGTTTSIILAGQLLQNAMALINKGIHPTTIITGYGLANVECMKFLEKAKEEGDKEKIIKTAFGTKLPNDIIEHLTKLFMDVKNYEDLKLYKVVNSNPLKSQIFKGTLFDGHTINDRMQSEVNGKIALLDFPINLKMDHIQVTDAKNLEDVTKKDTELKRRVVDSLLKEEVKCVFYTDTTPEFESYLTEMGITGIVLFQRENIDNISKVVDLPVSSSIDKIHTGFAEVKYEKPGKVYVKAKGKFETLVLHGSTPQVLAEMERSAHDVVSLLKHDIDAVVGAGAIELELARHLTHIANKVGGKEQLAIEKFAEALESIPLLIAENCGLDAIEILTNLKTQHIAGQKDMGVDSFSGISDAREKGIIEPVLVKIHAINSASNVANLILKLDKMLVGEEAK